MSNTSDQLDTLAHNLSQKGDDGQRLELVQRARRFKRSWVEMAEALCWVRDSRAFTRWGYKDLHDYCKEELHIRPSTVDKLVGGFATLREHAPQVLARDGVAQEIPTVDAVDYFSRALRPANDEASAPNTDVVRELKQAVFGENKPVAVLRREFNPILHPKPEGIEVVEKMEKAASAARRVLSTLPGLEELPKDLLARVDVALGELATELEARISDERERLGVRKTG